jgi:PAS domain S-box-containing protein
MLGTASVEGYFTHLNPAWARTLGWTVEQLMAEPFISFVHPDDVAATLEQARTLAASDGAKVVAFENRYRTAGGEYRWIQWVTVMDGGVLYFVARDITDSKTAMRERDQDASVMHAVVESVADGLYVADSQGQMTFINPAGVQLLGYESADELVGLGPHAAFHRTLASDGAHALADCPLSSVVTSGGPARRDDDGFRCKDGSTIPVSYSSAPVDLRDGTGSVVAFRDITELKARELEVRRELEAMSWVARIRDALDTDRLVLYAQPILEVETGETVQHELLVRMIGADGEIIAPGAFLPVAERYNLIQEIDRCVFKLAMGYAAAGRRVQVNMSAQSVSEPGLSRFVEDQIKAHRVDPQLVVFEITETALIHNEGVAQVFIENVRRLDCAVALDDFGTGYGSLRYLKHLPVSLLKIDQEFVRDLDGDESAVNGHVIQAIVALARGMGQKTVAEGVETESAYRIVKDLGVDYAQGYLFARPAPADDVFQLAQQEG